MRKISREAILAEPVRFCEGCGTALTWRQNDSPYQFRRRRFCSQKCALPKAVMAWRATLPSLEDRFWSHVDKTGDCWIWVAFRTPFGYGAVQVSGKKVHAHRVAYELTHGAIPVGMCVMHKCDNPPCVRPEHLCLGTASENTKDMYNKGRDRAARGEHSGAAKLTDQAVKDIRRRSSSGERKCDLAVEFGVSKATVTLVTQRRAWAHVED